MAERICSIDGCDRGLEARGLCHKHYARWQRRRPEYRERDNAANRARRKSEAYRQQIRERNRRRKDYLRQWERRNRYPGWAEWWERRRLREESEPWTWDPLGPVCRVLDAPKTREFVGGTCKACGIPWVYYRKRAQSPFCGECAAVRRKRPGSWRAKQWGAETEPIVPRFVFERDGYRCQICHRPTKGSVPQWMAPTLDHIVPLARGGSHIYANLQTACFRCNAVVKRDGQVEQQLALSI